MDTLNTFWIHEFQVKKTILVIFIFWRVISFIDYIHWYFLEIWQAKIRILKNDQNWLKSESTRRICWFAEKLYISLTQKLTKIQIQKQKNLFLKSKRLLMALYLKIWEIKISFPLSFSILDSKELVGNI